MKTMSFTNDIYNSIFLDIEERDDPFAGIASRLVSFTNGVSMVFAVNVGTRLREAYVSLQKKPDKANFPKWHGTSIDIAQLPAYGNEAYYVRMLQLPQSEDYIFEIVVEDLRVAVEAVDSSDKCLSTVVSILLKWKKFFQSERDLILSDELQEGLYGELTFLEKSIKRRCSGDVRCWAGGNRETHDFYFAQNAVEVKTSSKREPYSAVISSEYQLDATDVPGHLFLYYLALRKSRSTGECLPVIVNRIRAELENDSVMLTQFNDKLRQYGYYDEVADQYNIGFDVRDSYYFEIEENFPKIVRSMYQVGVSRVSYEVMISQCLPFECQEDTVFAAIGKGGADA